MAAPAGPWRQPQAGSPLDAADGAGGIYQKPNTSQPHAEHRVYPYLLRGLIIDRPNQVWVADVTYILMPTSFLYLIAIMDWHSRKVLAWQLSNTLHADFCVEALEEAVSRFGRPTIFNTDQGSQFTSIVFTAAPQAHRVRISMDGKGCCMDNIFIGRLWISLKYEDVYLQDYTTDSEARASIGRWIAADNATRPHQALGYRTSDKVYRQPPRSALVQSAVAVAAYVQPSGSTSPTRSRADLGLT